MKTRKALKVCNLFPALYFSLLGLAFVSLPLVASTMGEGAFMDTLVGLAFALAIGSGFVVGVWTLLSLALTAWHFIARKGTKPRPLYRQAALTFVLAGLFFFSFGIEDRLLAIFGQDQTWLLNLIYFVILILSFVLAWPHNRSLG